MANYKTPGVYIEEISTFPPSVAEVATAVPAFVGYTEIFPEDGEHSPVRINNMMEYEENFGMAPPPGYPSAAGSYPGFSVTVENNPSTNEFTLTSINKDPDKFILYYSMKLYFNNGGGSCYVVSAGTYSTDGVANSIDDEAMKSALDAVEKEDEPTILVLPDAVNLSTEGDYYSLCQSALAQCHKMKDRFAVFDVLDSDTDGAKFRNGVSLEPDYLKYGAAYLPYLQTGISYQYKEEEVQVTINVPGLKELTLPAEGSLNGIKISYDGASANPGIKVIEADTNTSITIDMDENGQMTINILTDGQAASELESAWQTLSETDSFVNPGFLIEVLGNGSDLIVNTGDTFMAMVPNPRTTNLAAIKTSDTAIYNQIKTDLNSQRVTLPPSTAVAGIYARVDRDRGVWKAPANVSVLNIVGPTRQLTNEEQDQLNLDATSGKSINVIRSFTGKGTLVWGARTLAGNDNEWRYISVRRLFNLIEESIQKSTAFAVFEPNTTTTWLKVKAMIDSYLYGLWQQGALAGPSPESAYFVNVGLGKTMTTQDILEGRLIIEIGVAAVRPAEFIVLRFSHKLQEA